MMKTRVVCVATLLLLPSPGSTHSPRKSMKSLDAGGNHARNAGASRPLTLVCAPAGFGKSLLVVDWASETGRSLAWVSLDEQDSDLRTFVRYFVAAVRSVSPGACPATEALLDSVDLPPVSTLRSKARLCR